MTHVFRPNGELASVNGLGELTDAAGYRLVGEHRMLVDHYGGVEVGYRVTGTTLIFDAVVPVPCTTTRCRLAAQYVVSSFLSGLPWHRAVTDGSATVEAGPGAG